MVAHLLRRLTNFAGLKPRRRVSLTSILTLLAGFAFNGAAYLHRTLATPAPPSYAAPEYFVDSEFASATGPNQSLALCSSHVRRAESLLPGRETPFTLTGSGAPDLVVGVGVIPKQFSHLAAKPILGRTLRSGDENHRRSVVVLSERLWRRRFGADPSVIGKTITLDAQDYVVIGVMPASFWFPHPSDPVELWVPAKSPLSAPDELKS